MRDTLADQVDRVAFTGTYTQSTSTPATIPDPVPPYVFCTYSTESIVQIDPPSSFTPGALLNHSNLEHEADWIYECTRLQGRAFQRRSRGPDADVVAFLAKDHVSHDLLPDDLDVRLAERDFPYKVSIPTSDSHPPCIHCLQFHCVRDCEDDYKPVANNLHRTVVQASPISGYGLFATVDMPPDTFLCEYVGEILWGDDTEMRNFVYRATNRSYLYNLDDQEGRTIDAAYMGNESRFINGSKHANCHAEREPGRILIYTTRRVEAGEELTLSYKLDGMYE